MEKQEKLTRIFIEDNLNLSFQNISINNENSNSRENKDFMKKRRKEAKD